MSPAANLAILSGVSLAAASAAAWYGISYSQSQLFGPTLVAPPLPDQLALTFDDGPNPAATPHLLEVLARRNVRATFFLIGGFARREPGLTRQIAAAGHVIGNHTMTHRFLPRLSSARILAELESCNRTIEDVLGQPVTLFRPPHGARSPAVFAAANRLQLKTVQWNLMVDDWKPVSAAVIAARMTRGVARQTRRGRGTCIVLHDGGQAGLNQPRLPTVHAVKALLAQLPATTRFVVPPHWT